MTKNGSQMTFWQFFLAFQFFHVIHIQKDIGLALRLCHKTKLFKNVTVSAYHKNSASRIESYGDQ
jgi:hypothetical protein